MAEFNSILYTCLSFIVGAIMGSFGNVVIYRMPKKLSIVKPRSFCYSCEKQVAWYDNIPIFSWIILGGKCRWCKAKFSWRYPLVEFLMGLLFLSVYQKYGFTWTTLEYFVFVFGLVVVSFIDFDHMILPDEFTIGGTVVALLGAWLNPERSFMPAFWGASLGFFLLWAIAYVYYLLRKEEGMGGGDIKLLAWIGGMVTWLGVPFVILAGCLVGSVVGLTIAVRTKGGLKSAIPFGPYLALGAIIYILAGDQLLEWYDMYLSLFIPPANVN